MTKSDITDNQGLWFIKEIIARVHHLSIDQLSPQSVQVLCCLLLNSILGLELKPLKLESILHIAPPPLGTVCCLTVDESHLVQGLFEELVQSCHHGARVVQQTGRNHGIVIQLKYEQ
ncbi:hypothetical protein DPMN_191609 [Dreissena polymorpha]|uniref:Uncharacterized protein n=1 Tax=Dreissena polymorpha TaxID=45954 RepID=A0A9D4BEZ2_DREPO|nr:hypothetical protein DPMN_191609 [Dreissena polymorpha]